MSRITADDVLPLCRDLVERPTPNPPGNEREVVERLEARLESSPVEFAIERRAVTPGRPNLVARTGDPDHGSVLLTGHTDTVPANADDWTDDPFTLRRDGDRIVGRGTADMKGALAAKVVAAEAFLTDADDPGEVVLGFVVDEESGGTGTQELVASGLDVDAAILGEGTDLGVGVAHKGSVRYHLTVRGRSSHSGRPDRGVSAIRKVRRVLEALEAFDAELRSETHELLPPGGSLTVTEIEGGIAPNVVPEEVTVTLDWRFLPGFEAPPEAFDERLRDALAGVTMDGQPVEFDLDRWNYKPAVEVSGESTVVTAVAEAARESGLSGDRVGFPAGTDAAYLVNDADVPTVLFGPGSIEEDAHTVDESVRVDDLVTTARVYRRALDRLVG
ncbi:MAG: M20 family metallopeptidase [Haloferacaceae archaeon]